MKTSRVLYVLLLAGIAIWLWTRFSGGDEARVRAQLDRLQALIEKQPGESALEAADRARQLADLLTRSFHVQLDPIGESIKDPAALSRPFVGLRRAAERLDVSFDGIEITMLEDGRHADVTFEATLSGKIDGTSRRGRYPVAIRFQDERGEWRLHDVRVGLEVEGGLF